jgi:SAM-dependent methyltransferase
MDQITSDIRDMYEKFPYPSGEPTNRLGSDVDLILSYGALAPTTSGSRQVLDAGCGRALGLIGAATLQPDVQFTGIDINRVGLADSQAAITQRGLKNIRLQEVDLMTLTGLATPPGGYDVIHSSGVIHHLSDPAASLALLRENLAPHGLVNLMVYGRNGRDPLLKTAAAIDVLFPADTPLVDRVALARQVAIYGSEHVLKGSRFADTGQVDDVEMVDRVLNANETTYDIAGLWQMIDAAGLRFVRWAEPLDWQTKMQVPDSDLRKHLLTLSLVEQYQFLEMVLCPPMLEVMLAHKDNAPRPDLGPADIAGTVFRVSPEVTIGTSVRHAPAGTRTETLELKVRNQDPVPITAGPTAATLLAMREWGDDLPGRDLQAKLAGLGLEAADIQAVILELLRVDVLYRPHR